MINLKSNTTQSTGVSTAYKNKTLFKQLRVSHDTQLNNKNNEFLFF